MRNIFHFLIFTAILCSVDSMALGSGRYWAQTHQWTNNGSYQTESFKIFGSKWRIQIQFNRKDKPEILCFDAVTEKFSPVINLRSGKSQHSTRSVSFKKTNNGDKFLCIKNTDSPWKITLEQYFEHTDEWLSRKDHARRISPAQNLGTWSGSGSQHISFTTQNSLWFLQAVPQQKGNFQITVKNSEDTVIFSSSMTAPDQKKICFFYAPGTYEMEIRAEVPWIIHAIQPQYQTLKTP